MCCRASGVRGIWSLSAEKVTGLVGMAMESDGRRVGDMVGAIEVYALDATAKCVGDALLLPVVCAGEWIAPVGRVVRFGCGLPSRYEVCAVGDAMRCDATSPCWSTSRLGVAPGHERREAGRRAVGRQQAVLRRECLVRARELER